MASQKPRYRKRSLPSGKGYTKVRGHTAIVYAGSTDEFPKWLSNVDAEFLSNRRSFYKGQEKVREEDQTLVLGFPAEWMREPEVIARLKAEGHDIPEDVPLEWCPEVN